MKSFNPIRSFLLGDRRAGAVRFILLVFIPLVILVWEIYQQFTVGGSFWLGWLVLMYIFSLMSALATATYYLKDIYDEELDGLPFRFLMASFFGLFTPKLRVRSRDDPSKEHRMVEMIGGPAHLIVDPGWVVLTESLTSPGKLYGHGKKHFMPRHERIQEIIDLHEQEAKIKEVPAYTRDGIKVMVEEVKLSYRIFDSRWETIYADGHITHTPYPYSKPAIHDYAYKRGVSINEKTLRPEQQTWKAAVTGRITNLIREHINEHKLDEIIAPREHSDKYVREEIRKKAYSNEFKNNLKSIGTILRWWDPGEFHSLEDVEKQYIANWSTNVQSEIQIHKAQGEAQKMAYEELGRAEAEAELLMTIIHALDGVKLGKDRVQTLQNLFLLRTAQVIKAFGSNTSTPKLND